MILIVELEDPGFSSELAADAFEDTFNHGKDWIPLGHLGHNLVIKEVRRRIHKDEFKHMSTAELGSIQLGG